MSSTAARLQRILAMVPWLLENRGASVAEVAARFDASPEEVVADLDLLGYCGIPGYGGGDLVEVSIVGDRISVRMADFFRRPLRLTVREATTLLLAGQALAGVETLPESRSLRTAVAKLSQLLAETHAAPQVAVDFDPTTAQHIETLREAAASGQVVRLVYRSASKRQTTERDVEPWTVVNAQGAWYLQGYCRMAAAPRDFRLDRIRDVTLTGEATPPGQPLAPPVYRPSPDHHRVVVDLAPSAWWLADLVIADRVTDRGRRRRLVFSTPELDWAARLLLRAGTAATVVSPPELTERLRGLAAAALDRYTG